MIKLLRNIRRNLLSEGKTTKYFKYAIGEIILVVIGILIALSINTWNEKRKIRQSEHAILINLESEIRTNQVNLDIVHKKHIEEYEDGLKMLRLFTTDISEIPINILEGLLASVETFWTFDSSDGFIKSLIASGKIDHIENDTIKTFITSYDGMLIDATQEGEPFQKVVSERLWPVIDGKLNGANRLRLIENFKDIPPRSYTSDYNWFYNNREMEDVISNLTTWKKDIISDEEKLIERIEQILLLIDTELKK